MGDTNTTAELQWKFCKFVQIPMYKISIMKDLMCMCFSQ